VAQLVSYYSISPPHFDSTGYHTPFTYYVVSQCLWHLSRVPQFAPVILLGLEIAITVYCIYCISPAFCCETK